LPPPSPDHREPTEPQQESTVQSIDTDTSTVAGRAAIVTGAAAGLGRAIAAELAHRGARVLLVDIDSGGLNDAAAALTAAGHEAVALRGDVGIEEEMVAAVTAVQERWGTLDIMVNNAAIQVATPLHEATLQDFDAHIAVNLRGTFFGCKHAVRAMRDGRGGSIVNIGSILSLAGDPHVPLYTMTKHGVLGLTRAVAVGYGADGIRCNCVCAGDMETPMIHRYWAQDPDPAQAQLRMESLYPRGRIGQTDEVARAVAFLASDAASFITGAAIPVEGGLLAQAPS
jgi:NAD(P)-dependent dehydrogenase (short-subunit alcohol dehydrogenase family)